MADEKEKQEEDSTGDSFIHQPSVISLSRDHLIGAIQGFNAGRALASNLPIEEVYLADSPKTKEAYGAWFHITCVKCGKSHAFNSPAELPLESLVCVCSNIVILYDIPRADCWRIGGIQLM